jgi:protein TonB
MTRRWLIALSLAAHFALAFALFAIGVWHIDQLPAGRHVTAALAVMSLPASGGGGPIAARKVDVVRKPVHQLVQPVPKPEQVVAQVATTAPAETPGEGSGDGSGSGIDPGGTGACAVPPCGLVDLAHADPPRPPDPPPLVTPPKFVPPVVIEALRIAGETQIHPAANTATEILRDGRSRVTAAFRVCLTAGGDVASVALALSTKYPAYDALLADGLRAWRYRPYLVDGRPTAVCGNVTFIYAIH